MKIHSGVKKTIRYRSFREAFLRVLKQPIATALLISLGPIASATYLIRRTLDLPQKTIYTFYKELYDDIGFWSYVQQRIIEARRREPRIGGWIEFNLATSLFVLTRIFKPRIVVETGVGPGSSSLFILNALEKNGFGRLYSIDLPRYDAIFYPTVGKRYDVHVPKGFSTGWLVHPRLKHRWILVLGDAKVKLPKLLGNLEVIDMFLHDSLHTYDHMMFEYSMAWKYLCKGGLLLSDDINQYWSLAFIDFCKSKKIPYYVILNRLGITKKS